MRIKNFFRGLGWVLAYIFSFIGILFITLYLLMFLFCKGPSPSIRETFVATMLETGNMKFVVKWYLSEEEILAITQQEHLPPAAPEGLFELNSTSTTSEASAQLTDASSGSTDTGLSLINSLEDPDGDGILLVPIAGRTFGAQLLIVRDPSKVQLASAYPFSSMEMEKNGYTVGEYAELTGAIAAVNAGEFETPSGINWGGRPIGVVVKNGQVEFAEPTAGDVLVGFDENHLLVVEPVGHMDSAAFTQFVKERGVLYGASFKDISDGNTNHFTRLIENGTPVNLSGKGVGANPRTAIGQCSDGTVLILVTDGRGSSGHLGATAQDLVNVLQQYGAVNAANLDGGSSSSLFFEGAYQITSSFLPNSDASRRLPTAFIVMP